MRTLVMGRVMVFLIVWLFKRGRVFGTSHQLVKCGFNVFYVATLVLEDLNIGIERANVGIDSLDFLLALEVVNNQCIDFLGMSGGHVEKCSRKWDRGESRELGGVGGTSEKNSFS
jgi:hypothetical protein